MDKVIVMIHYFLAKWRVYDLFLKLAGTEQGTHLGNRQEGDAENQHQKHRNDLIPAHAVKIANSYLLSAIFH